MFTEEANFHNIVKNDDLCVNKFVHKAYVNVDAASVEDENIFEGNITFEGYKTVFTLSRI